MARLAAVQALYQMELGGAGVEAVIREFLDHRFDADLEGEPLAEADHAYFGEILRGVVAEQAKIDAAVTQRLAAGWRLERLDATVRAMLRAGTFELMRPARRAAARSSSTSMSSSPSRSSPSPRRPSSSTPPWTAWPVTSGP